jgi:two-component system NtrC family sensor kinase
MSLKSKLVASFLTIIVLCGLVATTVGIHLIGTGIISQAQDKVTNDLNSARQIFQEETKNIKDVVRFTALRFFIKDAITDNDLQTLNEQLEQIRIAESFDVLSLTDENGRVIVRSRNPRLSGDNQADDPLVNRVLSNGSVIAATVIVPRAELLKEGADLAEQAYMKLVPTPKAKPSPETEQTSGMMIKAAAPVLGRDSRLLGVLYGGNLLNRNYRIVDRVKETVYQAVKYKGKDIGTATIFQTDVRISTNVKAEDGSRAIGTRLSEEVYRRVLTEGLPWMDRAFVVNAWYITAYEPIRDIESNVIGVLYVGILEQKFKDMQKRATAMFLAITLGGMVVAIVASTFLADGVLQPIKRLVYASQQWGQGNLDHRVRISGRDEIAELAETFNHMASSLKERDKQLKEYASQEIMKSEKLATLGQLAAGVAHEINNPLGAILMYAHLALEDLDSKEMLQSNLQKAVREASRCRDIVKGLLDFARQSEPKVQESDVNETLERTLALLVNQSLFQNVRISKVFCPSPPKIPMDVGQIQQVFTNFILNAAEAMDGKGDLTIVTRITPDNRYIEVEFTDAGCGIPPESREKIFEPFYSTKEVGRGTGLGLSISHGIIAKHKGTVEVSSEPGKGTTFIIRLPLRRKED